MNSDFTPPADPWALFADWYALAKQSEPAYPNAMMLATVGADGTPSARAVLMKDFDAKGVVFYTNRESRKGRELALTSKAGICFYWKSLQRQVRIEGNVSLVSDAEHRTLIFATRLVAAEVGVGLRSNRGELKNRSALEQAVQDVEKYEGRAVPRPSHWGGYRLAPSYFEFWQEREHRLHDRITYTHKPDTGLWAIERIFP